MPNAIHPERPRTTSQGSGTGEQTPIREVHHEPRKQPSGGTPAVLATTAAVANRRPPGCTEPHFLKLNR